MKALEVHDVWHWLRDLLEPLPGHPNGSEGANRTIDVLCASCVQDFDATACFRAGGIAVLSAITMGIALVRVFSLCSGGGGRRHPLSPLMVCLYYLVVLHCLANSLEWIFGWTTPLTLFVTYLKALELLIVCYFYTDVAVTMMGMNKVAGRSLNLGSLMLLFAFFTLFVTLGFAMRVEPWTDCHAPYWIWLSLGQLLCVQLMVFSFLIIIHRVNALAESPSIRSTQKGQIMCLLYVFECSAFADVAWHVGLFMLGDESKGCSGIFNHSQLQYSLFKAIYDVFSSLAPVWAILWVFRPSAARQVQRRFSDDDDSDASSTRTTDVIIVRNWQRRYRPLNVSRIETGSGRVTRSDDRNFVDPSRAVRRKRDGRNSPSGPGVRRVSSAPSLVPPPRRHSVSRSLISSPLYPIPEELIRENSGPSDDEGGPSSGLLHTFGNASTEALVDGDGEED